MRYLIAMLLAASAHASEDLIAEAKQAIGKTLKDPYSAVYEDIYMGKAAHGNPVVCGTLNAKNAYGAYTGRKRFYYLRGFDPQIGEDVVLQSFCGKR